MILLNTVKALKEIEPDRNFIQPVTVKKLNSLQLLSEIIKNTTEIKIKAISLSWDTFSVTVHTVFKSMLLSDCVAKISN